MAGVVIGDGSIIGARSVVVKDVPAGSIVACDPAAVIKSASDAQGENSVAQTLIVGLL